MRVRRRSVAPAVTVVAMLLLAGCGSSDHPKVTARSAGPSTASSTSATPPPQAEVTTALIRRSGDQLASVVKVGNSFEAATHKGRTGLMFWRYDGGWKSDGSAPHAQTVNGADTGPVKLSGAALAGSNHATFIVRGEFTGDGTGQAQAFGRGSGGWGVLKGQSDGSLLAQPAQGTDREGLELAMNFSGGLLHTSSLWGSDSKASFALQGSAPVERTFAGDGDKLKETGSNQFTAQSVGEKSLGRAPAGQPSSRLPDGTWLVFVNSVRQVGDGVLDEASYQLSVDGMTTPGDCSGEGTEQLDNNICYVRGPTQTVTMSAQIKTDTPMGTDGGSGIGQVTAPGWVFAAQYIEDSPLVTSDYQGLDLSLFTAGAPYYVPPGLAKDAALNSPFVLLTLQGGQVTQATSYFTP